MNKQELKQLKERLLDNSINSVDKPGCSTETLKEQIQKILIENRTPKSKKTKACIRHIKRYMYIDISTRNLIKKLRGK